MDIETKRVNSKLFLRNQFVLCLSAFVLLLFIFLINNKWNPSIIEENKIQLFFKDWQTFESWVSYFALIAAALTVIFGLKCSSHNLGVLKLGRERLYANKTIFPVEKMTQLKFIINSPSVFGTRSTRQGFKNWVEFSMDNESRKFEFYIKDQAMEDTLVNLLDELKTRYAIEVVVDKRAKESLFESWFGNG